jgi:hypothetical protein
LVARRISHLLTVPSDRRATTRANPAATAIADSYRKREMFCPCRQFIYSLIVVYDFFPTDSSAGLDILNGRNPGVPLRSTPGFMLSPATAGWDPVGYRCIEYKL